MTVVTHAPCCLPSVHAELCEERLCFLYFRDFDSLSLTEAQQVQQSAEEKHQEEEPPNENQGIAPSGEIENEGAPAVQGPDVEAFQQELALLKIEDEPGDGPDVREGTLPTFDPIKCWKQVMGSLRFKPRQMKTETKNVVLMLEI
ncbi:P antigen family member 5 [Piliocolobus tephrosceles]|uniref:P antigen family member 5 n=1 Tax=Piliocolobus tephrosceles TaxID=591936 RepID=UPI001300DE2A|nr:P antigen family member 5 [Piliocolobus tephrosceles]